MSDEFRFFAEPPRRSDPTDARESRADGPADAFETADEPIEAMIVEPTAAAANVDADGLVAAEVVSPAPAAPWAIDTRGHSSRRFGGDRFRERPRRKWPWIVALVVGIPVACVAAIGLLGWLFVASARELPLTEMDRAVVLKAEDVAELHPILEVRPAAATIRKVRYPDGTYDVEYEYEADEREDVELYMTCTVTVERNASDAATSYSMIAVGTQIGMSAAGNVTIRARDDLFRWGDASSHSLIENQFGTVGNVFRARSGRYVFDVTIIGVYFDDAQMLAELLTPKLERMKNYEP